MLLLFSDFPEKLPLCCKVNNFGSYALSPGSGQFHVFLTYVIKVDKREVLTIYLLSIFMCFCYFQAFQENY